MFWISIKISISAPKPIDLNFLRKFDRNLRVPRVFRVGSEWIVFARFKKKVDRNRCRGYLPQPWKTGATYDADKKAHSMMKKLPNENKDIKRSEDFRFGDDHPSQAKAFKCPLCDHECFWSGNLVEHLDQKHKNVTQRLRDSKDLDQGMEVLVLSKSSRTCLPGYVVEINKDDGWVSLLYGRGDEKKLKQISPNEVYTHLRSCPEELALRIADRIVTNAGTLGTVKYIGKIAGKPGIFLGIALDEPEGGKNNGIAAGIQYFKCPPKQGLFTRPWMINRISMIRLPGLPLRSSGILAKPIKLDEKNDPQKAQAEDAEERERSPSPALSVASEASSVCSMNSTTSFVMDLGKIDKSAETLSWTDIFQARSKTPNKDVRNPFVLGLQKTGRPGPTVHSTPTHYSKEEVTRAEREARLLDQELSSATDALRRMQFQMALLKEQVANQQNVINAQEDRVSELQNRRDKAARVANAFRSALAEASAAKPRQETQAGSVSGLSRKGNGSSQKNHARKVSFEDLKRSFGSKTAWGYRDGDREEAESSPRKSVVQKRLDLLTDKAVAPLPVVASPVHVRRKTSPRISPRSSPRRAPVITWRGSEQVEDEEDDRELDSDDEKVDKQTTNRQREFFSRGKQTDRPGLTRSTSDPRHGHDDAERLRRASVHCDESLRVTRPALKPNNSNPEQLRVNPPPPVKPPDNSTASSPTGLLSPSQAKFVRGSATLNEVFFNQASPGPSLDPEIEIKNRVIAFGKSCPGRRTQGSHGVLVWKIVDGVSANISAWEKEFRINNLRFYGRSSTPETAAVHWRFYKPSNQRHFFRGAET